VLPPLEAERPHHPAAAGIEHVGLEPRRGEDVALGVEPQHRLVLAMGLDDGLSGGREPGELDAAGTAVQQLAQELVLVVEPAGVRIVGEQVDAVMRSAEPPRPLFAASRQVKIYRVAIPPRAAPKSPTNPGRPSFRREPPSLAQALVDGVGRNPEEAGETLGAAGELRTLVVGLAEGDLRLTIGAVA
jgi:hypothetical protein